VRSCTSCGRESPDDARFCAACGALLDDAEPRELRKTVTVLFSDVTGSTAIGERLDPEPLRRLMLRWYKEMKAVCEAHGGRVRELIGDAVMAAFGIPAVHEDDALRAVRAAAGMRERLERLNDELERDFGVRLQSRTGVNTGEVIVRDPDPSGALALGDPVNVAARLQTAAEPGEILLGEATHRLVRDAVRAEPVEPLELKGKGEPVSAYRLLEVLPQAEALARHLETPMVGRRRELVMLRQAFERTLDERSCHLITVFGPAGIGKTRLVQELARSVQDEATVLTGRCLPYGEAITYWPIREMLYEVTGEDVRGNLGTLLAGMEDEDIVTGRVASVVGIEEGSAAGEETFWALRRVFELLAHEQPVVLCFDDLQWGEPTLLELVEYLADWIREAPVVLLCLARPELLDERPTWGGGKLNASSLLLAPLDERESRALVDTLGEDRSIPAELRGRLVATAQGNPLFLEQMVAMLAEGEDGAGEVAVPPAIKALLGARLDRLEPEERQVLERASVEGEQFHVGAVVALTQGDAGEIEACLRKLVAKELLRSDRPAIPTEKAFRFRHSLIREAAYESIPKEARADLHERFARWLEQVTGERADEYEEFLGYHLEQASRLLAELGSPDERAEGLADQAGRLLASAGRRAFARADVPAGVNLVERALSLLPNDSPVALELLPDLGVALFEIGSNERAESVCREAIGRARAAGDRRLECHAAVVGSLLRLYTHPEDVDLDCVRREAEQALAVFDERNDDLGRSRVYAVLFEIEWLAGRIIGAAANAERLIEYAPRAGNRPDEIRGLGDFYWVMVDGPTPVQEARERLLEISRGGSVEALTAVYLAVFAGMEGRFDEARELMARGRVGLAEVGLNYWVGAAGRFDAQLDMLADNPALAEHHLRETRKVFTESGNAWLASHAEVDIAHAIHRQGRHDDAYALTEAFVAAPARADRYWQIRRRAIRAKVLAVRGALDEAIGLAREAAAIAAQTDFLNVRGDTLLDLAEVLRLAGRPHEAIPALEEAVALYERKGNVVSAAKARALLQEPAA
jgi:class 3 adenylate cyclase/tetratricopeptide (TPR) repeat protein